MRPDNIKRVLPDVCTKYGAPMGRPNRGHEPHTVTSGKACKIYKKNQTKIYDKRVRLDAGGYDMGGAYWGTGSELRVRFTANLDFIQFYRV